ncbi:vancomycin B-type resistance protein VanW [bacterium BMS3Abin15]|nr:vancomycin B-type resistance protein VanW [bacterium BMS3Abin15]
MKISFHITVLTFFILLLSPISGVFASEENSKELKLMMGELEEAISYEEISQWTVIKTTLMNDKNARAEIENIHYCPTDPIFCRLTKTYRERNHLVKKSARIVEKKALYSFLEDLGRRVNKDPVDAKFAVEDEKVSAFAFSKNGMELDVGSSAKILLDAISQKNHSNEKFPEEVHLVYKIIEPEIKSEDIETLGINILIGEGKSNFRGSPKNRVHNIKVASNRFNGVLIKPGEEFSFVEILGPVDEEHGYKEELVIKKDKTEPEFGGGVCQVSTTTFRAAIYSGMEITARRNHAYPVAYYNPQGMDATVYIPRPDLRFINNTSGHVLIQTKVEGTELIFQFYGTDDGRRIEIIGPRILERNPDNSMKATFTQKVYDKDENLIIDDVFNSSYDSPDKYPHPGEEKLTEKPKEWSKGEWRRYKKEHGL